jgi:ABC-2 type transport system ATP-binding protein
VIATWRPIWRVPRAGRRHRPDDARGLCGAGKLQRDIAWFNPAHEDNYYIAAAILPWNGQLDAAQYVLRQASEARTLTGIRCFTTVSLLSFSQGPGDRRAVAAQRPSRASRPAGRVGAAECRCLWIEKGYQTANAAGMVEAMAQDSPPGAFRNYLQVRARRLRDLAALQTRRHAFSRALRQGMWKELEDLVSSGLLAELPKDPLGLWLRPRRFGLADPECNAFEYPMMLPAIAIDDLEKSYPRKWRSAPVVALGGVSLTVEPGEAFGFIGANGAGKTTAIKILMGLIRATRGSAQIFGTSVARSGGPPGPGLRSREPLSLRLSDAARNPLDGHAPASGAGQCAESHCLAWLERLGLAQVASKAIRSFSKGMTQRVAIAQALCIKPRLLILDEPLSGLDPIGRRDVVDILSEYKRGGGTLFLTSHVLHDVERLADRFGLIHKGVLRAVRSPAELTGDQEMVLVRTFGQTPVDGMREDFSGRWIGEVPRGDLWERLEALRTCRARVLEVRTAVAGGGLHARRRRVCRRIHACGRTGPMKGSQNEIPPEAAARACDAHRWTRRAWR